MPKNKKSQKDIFKWSDFFSFIWLLLGKYRWKYLSLVVALAIVQFYIIVPPLILGKIVDFFVSFESGESLRNFYLLSLLLGFSFPIIAFLRLTFKRILGNFRSEVFYEIKVNSLERLLRFSLTWHDKESVGSKFQKIQNGLRGLDSFAYYFNNQILWSSAAFIGIIIVFIFLKPVYIFFFLVYVLCFVIVLKAFYLRIQRENDEFNKSLETASGTYVESLGNILTVKALGASKAFKDRAAVKEEVTKKHEYRLRRLSTTMWQSFQALNGICYGVFLFLVGTGVANGQITPGAIVIFYGYLERLVGSATDILDVYENILGAKSAAGRMAKIYLLKEEKVSGTKTFPEVWNDLRITKGGFSYKGKLKEKSVADLRNINFLVKKGEKVGIVGKTGSGKSTLSKILMGLYSLDSGKYKIGKTEFGEIQTDEVTKNMTLVLQDSEMFNLSLSENITLMGKMKQELFDKAIEIAELQEVIDKLPNGLETLIGEKGYHLSGGERQRIAIARAIYKDSQVIVFDEATSSLDNKTESKIFENLDNYLQNKTIVTIAHRVSTLKNTDKVYVFEKGRIVEEGTYESLSKNPNSVFSKVYLKKLSVALS